MMGWLSAPSEILFSLGPITIYWYGVFVAIGMATCYAIFSRFVRASGVAEKHADRIFILALLGGAVGGRLLYVLYHLDFFRMVPAEIPAVWNGGWVWHGGIAGAALAMYLYCRFVKIALLPVADAFAPGLALGQAIGRLGNYVNQEAYGPPTDLPWGIPIEPSHRLPGFEFATHFHPAFAYEGLFDLLIFFLLFFLAKQALARTRINYRVGRLFLIYLFLYSIGRFGIEFFRIDSVPVWLGLRAPQWISMGLIALSGALLLQRGKKLI